MARKPRVHVVSFRISRLEKKWLKEQCMENESTSEAARRILLQCKAVEQKGQKI